MQNRVQTVQAVTRAAGTGNEHGGAVAAAARGLDRLPIATFRPAPPLPPVEDYTFLGYRNADGSVGTRNILAITSTVQCVSGVVAFAVERIKSELLPQYPHVDDVVGRVDRSANTTPGNKEGGLSNIVEKAMGSIVKSGSAPITGVLSPGASPTATPRSRSWAGSCSGCCSTWPAAGRPGPSTGGLRTRWSCSIRRR